MRREHFQFQHRQRPTRDLKVVCSSEFSISCVHVHGTTCLIESGFTEATATATLSSIAGWPQGSVPTEAPSVEKAGNLAVAQATTLLVCDTKGICLMLGPAILIFDIT